MRDDIYAHRLRGKFIFANGDHRATHARSLEPESDDEHERDERIDPKQIRVFRNAVETERSADGRWPELRCFRVVQFVGRANHGFCLLQKDAKNFAEAQCDDRQIVTLQAKRRQANDVARGVRIQASDETCCDKQPRAGSQEAAMLCR